MEQLLSLLKIEIKNSLNGVLKKQKKKSIFTIPIIILVVIAIIFYVVIYSDIIFGFFLGSGLEYSVPVTMLTILSVVITFLCIQSINGSIFNVKNLDTIISLPIKIKYIVFSKILSMYSTYTLISILAVTGIAISYFKNIGFSFVMLFNFSKYAFLIPIIPICIGIILGGVISYVSSKFNISTFLNIFLNILIFILLMYVYLGGGVTPETVKVNTTINKIYPFADFFENSFKNGSIVDVIIFGVISLVLILSLTFILSIKYLEINNAVSSVFTKSNYKMKSLKTNGVIEALYKKDMKIFLSSPIYILNYGLVPIVLVLGSIYLSFFNKNIILENIDMINSGKETFWYYVPIALASATAVFATTSVSISIEGKSFWVVKSLPIKFESVFISKILLSLTVQIPAVFISLGILMYVVGFDFNIFIFTLIFTPLLCVFTSISGLIINIRFPKMNWKTEVEVIKQSLSSFISLMAFMVLAFALMYVTSVIKIDKVLYLIIVCLVFFVMDVLAWSYLNKVSVLELQEV
ncbi:MAG: hypothetical protein ACRCZK_00895 [Oscillospiraceae bacterium]